MSLNWFKSKRIKWCYEFSLRGRNSLNTTNNVSKTIGFTIHKPNPNQFSQAPLFEWNICYW